MKSDPLELYLKNQDRIDRDREILDYYRKGNAMKFRKPFDATGWIVGALALGFIIGHFVTIISLTIPVGQ